MHICVCTLLLFYETQGKAHLVLSQHITCTTPLSTGLFRHFLAISTSYQKQWRFQYNNSVTCPKPSRELHKLLSIDPRDLRKQYAVALINTISRVCTQWSIWEQISGLLRAEIEARFLRLQATCYGNFWPSRDKGMIVVVWRALAKFDTPCEMLNSAPFCTRRRRAPGMNDYQLVFLKQQFPFILQCHCVFRQQLT